MALAIHKTMGSVLGSSVTTVAGFISLCFMSFTMGRDLGIVMAKGVLLGVIGSVSLLPSLILVFDKALEKTEHRPLIPDAEKFSGGIVRIFPVFPLIFALLIPPAFAGYSQTNEEVYYDLGECLSEDMDYAVATRKLAEEFGMGSAHMLLVDGGLSPKATQEMISRMEQVEGVKAVLGLDSLAGPPGSGGIPAGIPHGTASQSPEGTDAGQLRIHFCQ